jgi:hypothetical protein
MVAEISQFQKDKQVINSHISTKEQTSLFVSCKPSGNKYGGGQPHAVPKWPKRLPENLPEISPVFDTFLWLLTDLFPSYKLVTLSAWPYAASPYTPYFSSP